MDAIGKFAAEHVKGSKEFFCTKTQKIEAAVSAGIEGRW